MSQDYLCKSPHIDSFEMLSECSFHSKTGCGHGQRIIELTELNGQLNSLLLERIQQVERFVEERTRMKADIQHYHAKVVKISEDYVYEQQQKEAFMVEAKGIFEAKEAVFKAEYERYMSVQRNTIQKLTEQLEEARRSSEQILIDADEEYRERSKVVQEKNKCIEEQQEVIYEYKEEIELLRQEMQSHRALSERSTKQSEEEIEGVKCLLEQKVAIIRDLEVDFTRLTQVCNEKEMALHSLQESYMCKSHALAEAKEKSISDARVIEQLEAALKKIKEQNEMIGIQMDKCEQDKREIERQMKTRILELENLNAVKSAKIQEVEGNLCAQVNEKQAKIEDLRKASIKYEDAARQLSNFQDSLNEKQHRIEEMQKIIAKEKKENFAKNDEIATSQQTAEKLSKKVKQLLRQLGDAQNRQMELEQEKGHQDSLLAHKQTVIVAQQAKMDSMRNQTAIEINRAIQYHSASSGRQHGSPSSSSPPPHFQMVPPAVGVTRMNSSPIRTVTHQIAYQGQTGSPRQQLEMLSDNDQLNRQILSRCRQIAQHY